MVCLLSKNAVNGQAVSQYWGFSTIALSQPSSFVLAKALKKDTLILTLPSGASSCGWQFYVRYGGEMSLDYRLLWC